MYRFTLLLFLFCLLSSPLITSAASLSLGPTSGTFTTGSTFDVSIFLNSGEQPVNAVGAFLQFPPDKLQLVSPSVGKSIIGVWVTAPQFNNQTGEVSLEGVIPGGLKADNGLLTTLTFRVKSVGQAVVKFLNQSKVLLNDGVGTDALEKIQNGIYQLVLPPPAGPLVASETHPDQSKWYPNDNLVLTWASGESSVQGYSYVLNEEPIDVPDDVSEGLRNGVSHKSLTEGRHFFHIKALRAGVWGETTHFAVLVDKTPPAEFPLEILPDPRTASRRPVMQFATTDNSSGFDHYELKLVSLQASDKLDQGEQSLFIETTSPYVPQTLALGDYDVIVRAYDIAGNYREVTKRLAIVTPLFQIFSDRGLVIRNIFAIPWPWLWGILGLLLIFLAYLSWRFRLIHFHLYRAHENKALPEHVQDQLSELQKYRERYGKALMIIFLLGSILSTRQVSAQVSGEALVPPVVTSISRHISNRDIFYLGGRSDSPNSQVIIYLQNPTTGELTSYKVSTDNDGEWFYRHGSLLPAGGYLLWTQAKQGNELSPPGPQFGLAVDAEAWQFGASRLSYEVIYLFAILILLIALVWLSVDVLIHRKKIKHRRALLNHEVRQAEESVRRGFALLRRDIEEELRATRDKEARENLLLDLEKVEKYIGKEVWDVEKVRYN